MLRFDFKSKQKEIAALDYWEMGILDLKISYFGDEVSLCIEDIITKKNTGKLSF